MIILIIIYVIVNLCVELCSKREVNLKVLKVPEIEQKVESCTFFQFVVAV